MVVAGERDDAPLLVHLFDDRPEEGTSDRAADSVRDQLSRVGADVVTDQSGRAIRLRRAPSR